MNLTLALFAFLFTSYTFAYTFPSKPLIASHRRQCQFAGAIKMSSYSLTSGSTDVTSIPNGLKLGFVGCGTIASALVVGIAQQTCIPVKSIIISKRSDSKSSSLKLQFPSLVTIADNNHDIVRGADVVFITVLPQQASEVVQGLQFEPERHVLISLVSTSKIETLSNDSKLPITQVFKMICLPAVAYSEGVCLLQRKQRIEETIVYSLCIIQSIEKLELLLNSLGGVIMAETDEEMAAMMVPSALMGAFYGVLRNNRDWLIRRHNIAPEKASMLVHRMYHAMIQDVDRKSRMDKTSSVHLLDALIEEQTPGGLNEQVLKNLESLGIMNSYDLAQDLILERIIGKSKGFLPESI